MRLRLTFALFLPLALSSPAAAQVRAVPAEAGTAPLAGRLAAPVSIPAPALLMTLTAPLTGSPGFVSAPTPVAAAPAVSVVAQTPAVARALSAADGAHALLSNTIPALAAASILAAPAPAAFAQEKAAVPSPTNFTDRSIGTGRSTGRAAAVVNAAAATMPSGLDEMYDGRADLPALPAAADGSELRADRTPGPALAPRTSRRVQQALVVAAPLAAVGAVAFGAFTPDLAMTALHLLGQAAYWVANPLAFVFTVPQIHRILSRRSAEVSTSMTMVGLLSALVTTLCFAFDGKGLMMYRNLAQTAGFAAMLGLEFKYGRQAKGTAPSRRRALIETGAVVLGFGALLAFLGPALMSVIPPIALMSSLLVPFQILAGFGFTYMMYAQLKKMSLEHSAGDASSKMMWAYLGTKIIWIWSFATMLSLVAAPAWLTLAGGAAFAGVSWLATRALLTHLLRTPWAFLPEKISLRGRTITRRVLGDAAAFVALAALILLLSGVGHLAFTAFLGIKAGAGSLFAMYLLYTVQNLVAALATSKTLRLQAQFGREALAPRP